MTVKNHVELCLYVTFDLVKLSVNYWQLDIAYVYESLKFAAG